MLFTPSPPLSAQSVSSSVESDSSPTHTVSVSNTHNVENQQHIISPPNNPTLVVTNGPSNSQSSSSQLSEQDYFYSPFSSSSSRPSIHLTPTKTPTNFKLLKSRRRDSCPVSPLQKRLNRFHLPTNITSTIRNALMASIPNPDSNMYDTDDKSHISKTNLWYNNNTIMPVANPVAAAALVEDTANDEQVTRSLTPSPLDTPKNNRSPTECSANVSSSNITNNRKVTLNVGGVRHEGSLFMYLFYHINISIYSFMAYTFSSSKYTSRSPG
jgi:hypothetical protein